MVSGGSGVLQRLREAWKWPLARSASARDGKGTVIFASTDEDFTLVYRPNLSVRDVCTEAAIKVNISPVALDFFTLVSEDGSLYLNPNKVLCEAECSQVYTFKLYVKACHVAELREIDKQAFEYYFHQCRQDFLRGNIREFGDACHFAKAVLNEIIFSAKQKGVSSKVIIEHPVRHGIKRLLQAGLFEGYPIQEVKKVLKEKIKLYENLKEDQIKLQYIASLERADDFFMHKLSFEKIYSVKNVISHRKFEVLVSEFGIKKRRIDAENKARPPEDIVENFSEVVALEIDELKNEVTIIRKNCGPENLKACSPQAANSLVTLIEGYYRLMVNQYKQLRLQGKKSRSCLFCHGPISRARAEYLLKNGSKQDGSFLIRKSRKCHFSHNLSLYTGNEVKHYIIKRNTSEELGTFSLDSDPKKRFSSLLELIEHYKQSKDGLPVSLSVICPPQTEGLSALLDREAMTPAPPDLSLVDSSFKIPLRNLETEQFALSKGEFGELKKGSWLCPSGENPLLPVVSRALVKPVGRKKILEFHEAMRTFLQLKNQHLIQLYGISETQKALILVFEFASNGPLDCYIKKESERITKGRVLSYAVQIAEGMMFLHSKGCVHGRLSAHNVLVSSDEFVKISDYGLWHLVKRGQIFHTSKREDGYSYCWFSPLSLQGNTFDLQSDIWSFGMTLWEMLTMKKPFHCSLTNQVLDKEQVLSRYLRQRFLNPDRPNIPTKVRELIRTCWAPEPQDRPNFQDLVTSLRSAELVPGNEAEEILRVPPISELEDWEIPTPLKQDQLGLKKHRADSQVSNGDYSYLPGNQTQTNSCVTGGNLPGITIVPSVSLFNSSNSRKQSVSKTFSHPGFTQPLFETEAVSQFNFLAPRKPSITRTSSCPPAIQATSESREVNSAVHHTEAEKPSSAPEIDMVENDNRQMPFFPFPPEVESQTVDISAEKTVVPSPEELTNAEDSTDDSDSDDGQNAGLCAEALAMKALGGIARIPGTLPDSPFVLCFGEERKDGRIEQFSEHGLFAYTRFNKSMSSPGLVLEASLVSSTDEYHNNDESNVGECNEEQLEGVSFNPISVHKKASITSDDQRPGPRKNRKMGTGSYVKIPVTQPNTKLQDHGEDTTILQNSSAANSSVRIAISRSASPHSSVSNIKGSSSSYSKVYVRDPKKLVLMEDMDASPDLVNESLATASFASKTADEFLASFTNIGPHLGMEDFYRVEFLADSEGDDSREEGSSPLITDPHDDSGSNDTDSSSLDDAESSLCRMFVSGRNRSMQETSGGGDKILDPGFELNLRLHEPPFGQNDEEDCADDVQARLSRDSNTLFKSFLSREVSTHGLDLGSPLSEEGQDPFSPSPFDRDAIRSNSPSKLENSADTRDDDEEENSDNVLGTSSASVAYMPSKVHFLNSPILRFDEGLDNLEMMECPLNNLSKECMKKATELLFFSDNQSANQGGLGLNQLDDALSDDGCPLDNDQEAEVEIERTISENSAPNPYKADVDGRLKEVLGTPGHSGSEGHMSREVQPVISGDTSNGYRRTMEQEPFQALSRSSSSDGIWPDTSGKLDKIKPRSASCWSWEEEQLDMSKIPPKLQIPYEQLRLKGVLGRGFFGEVRKANLVYTDSWNIPKNEEVAVKLLTTTDSKRNFRDFIKEVQNMVELESKEKCPFIIKLRGVTKDLENKLMLVMELAPSGALRQYLPENKDILGTRELLTFCMQICQGMAYLEKHSMLHRDLAARNILVMREDLVKISDFGLSRLQDYYKLLPKTNEEVHLPVKWHALESLLKHSFTTKSDVWSFGITMWEIFTYGGDPYKSMETSEVISFLEEGNRLNRPEKCPEKVFEVMKSCWHNDPMKRPSFYFLETSSLKECISDPEREPQLCW